MTKGERGYTAYGQTAGWKTFDGRPMPRWADLGESPAGRETRRRWEVAAAAIAEHPDDPVGETTPC